MRLNLNNISKRYGTVSVLREINLDIEKGEFCVLLGPSGCGKSTLLRMIAGLETISSGQLSIGDRVMNDVHPRDRDIAMVFQNYALYPQMSVAKNLGYPLKINKTPKAEISKRVAEVAEQLELSSLLDRKPSALSGGQRQRVAMGRALVRNPKIFLMDEPLSNLDARLRAQMRVDIREIQKRLNVTTVYVTHDQVEAMTMADRIVVMSKGEIQQIGTPDEIYEEPANSFVAQFVGSPPMNFIEDAQIVLGDDWANSFLGVRPEGIVRKAPKGKAITLRAFCTSAESLGSESICYFDIILGDRSIAKLTAKWAGNLRSLEGSTLDLHIPYQKIYKFDQETGQRLPTTAGE